MEATMNKSYYDCIFKRKSFHLFRDNITKTPFKSIYKISTEEIASIYNYYNLLLSIYPNINTKIKIVSSEETNCNRGEEYCILFYSEIKQNYLQNIGYLGEKLDLYLVNKNIGTLWFGIGKVNDNTYDNLAFITMMGISKTIPSYFRKDMYKAKRKPISQIYESTCHTYESIIDIARFAPSSCNLQPWFIKEDDKNLYVYRYYDKSKRGIMPFDKVIYQNLIDIGILMCFLETTLNHFNIIYKLTTFNDDTLNTNEYTLEYQLTWV